MRKLERSDAPRCLSSYKHGRDKWDRSSPDANCRNQIWQQLNTMQNGFCAYCERSIERGKAHIEHFFRRHEEPKRTFDWTNIFGSCHEHETCGNYKDNKAKNIDLKKVCKPDEVNPANFLEFLPNGKVQPRLGLVGREKEIAENTINVFHLNISGLIGRRRITIQNERMQCQELLKALIEFPDDIELQQEKANRLAEIKNQEFYTARYTVWK